MQIKCALCEGYIGELSGVIIKGTKWLVVHESCLWPKAPAEKGEGKGDMPDFLKDLFRGRI